MRSPLWMGGRGKGEAGWEQCAGHQEDNRFQEGEVFAANTSWADVWLAGHHKTLQLLASVRDIKRTVFVYHGPVSYPSDAAKVVRSFPKHHQPSIVPFLKRPEFGRQQEYRFTIRFRGEPQTKTLHLPIATELRCLASVVWEESGRVAR